MGGGDKKKEKWFNIKVCGSWRMAFLLARLQRMYWDERAAWLRAPIALPGHDNNTGDLANAEGEVDNISADATGTPTLEAAKPSDTDQSACTGSPSASTESTRDVAKGKDPITPKKRPLLGAKEERSQKSAKKKDKTEGQKVEKATPLKEQQLKRIGADTLASSVRLQQILAARQQQQQ